MPVPALQTALRAIYPPRCLSCGGLVDSDFGLCGPCFAQTRFIAGAVCDSCGAPLPGEAGQTDHCDDCLRIARPWARGRSALVYAGTGRALVLSLKHGDRHDIVRPAALWLARAAAPLICPDTVIVPVPLHLTRLIARRYNQAALLTQALARQTGVAHCPDALQRHRRTPSLDGQGRDARFATLSSAIRAHPRRLSQISGRPVLLIDDVMTSGATLAACCEALQTAAPTEVSVAVLARVVKDA